MRRPGYVKVTSHCPKNPWPLANKEKMDILKRVGVKFGEMGHSLYLTGSASGKEEADKVNDLKEYRLKNEKPARLLYESRQYGRDHFVSQEPKMLQNSVLLFAQEMWNKF